MPRFKNTGLAPVVVGDGISVAPGEIVDLDSEDSGLLVEVPEAKPKRSAQAAKESDA
jgi:hypothetical protein